MREKWLPFERDSAAFLGFAPVFIFLNFRLALKYCSSLLLPNSWKAGHGEHFFPGPFLGKQIVSWRKGDVQKPKDLKLGRNRITVTQSNHRSALTWQPGGFFFPSPPYDNEKRREASESKWMRGLCYQSIALHWGWQLASLSERLGPLKAVKIWSLKLFRLL